MNDSTGLELVRQLRVLRELMKVKMCYEFTDRLQRPPISAEEKMKRYNDFNHSIDKAYDVYNI